MNTAQSNSRPEQFSIYQGKTQFRYNIEEKTRINDKGEEETYYEYLYINSNIDINAPTIVKYYNLVTDIICNEFNTPPEELGMLRKTVAGLILQINFIMEHLGIALPNEYEDVFKNEYNDKVELIKTMLKTELGMNNIPSPSSSPNQSLTEEERNREPSEEYL